MQRGACRSERELRLAGMRAVRGALPSPHSERPLLSPARAAGPARGRPWSWRAVRASTACGRLASLALGCPLLAGSCGRDEEGAASQTQRPAGSNLCSCPRLAGARLLRSPVPRAPSFPCRRAPKRAADGACVEQGLRGRPPKPGAPLPGLPTSGGRFGPAWAARPGLEKRGVVQSAPLENAPPVSTLF